MLTTDHEACNVLADLLTAHGVRHVVMSPGSRNAPLVVALSRRPGLKCHVVIDERSAAFIALGMGVQSGQPVALVCTSGTALLNYAPAVAEAFYRRVPLVVVSADRPMEWIDQDDSQTIWQQDALAPYVKRGCDIGAHLGHRDGLWWADRVINDVLLECRAGCPGPVHINMRLAAPLGGEARYETGSARLVQRVSAPGQLPVAEARALARELASPRRVLVICGFMRPDARLNRALSRMARMPNVAVMTETVANLHSPLFVSRIDATLRVLDAGARGQLAPDVVITLGGALVSRHVKEWVRSLTGVEHWHVGPGHTTVDCFRHLSRRIDLPPAAFMAQLASGMQIHRTPCTYAAAWRDAAAKGTAGVEAYVAAAPWCDFKALELVMGTLPERTDLHLSNGTPVRYIQLLDSSRVHRCECNRGVSGIDGCTSTALGASVVYRGGLTVLISGDMSFQYDIAALSSTLMGPQFKMIVMCNGGGGIFRFIGSTRHLPECGPYFAVGTRLPLAQLCQGYGVACFEATDMESLAEALPRFWATGDRPALLAIHTDGEVSAQALRGYFGD